MNLGRVGFLAKVEPDGLERALDQVAAGDFAVDERFRIEATVVRADGARETHPCLNEVVVARGARVRMIQVEVDVSGSHLATYVADVWSPRPPAQPRTPSAPAARSWTRGCAT